MPTSPTTPRRASKSRRSAPVTPARLDVVPSKPLGVSDSNSVRDRIRQWQEQGAKVISSPVASDISATGDENAGMKAPCQPPSREKKYVKGADTTPRRKPTRWVDPDRKEWIREPRSSTAPKKRVISDEHWKKTQKRSPRSRQYPSKQPLKEELRPEDPDSDAPRLISSKMEREVRRQRRKKRRSSAGSGMMHDEKASIDLDGSSPLPRRPSAKQEVLIQSDFDSGVDDDLPRRIQTRVSPSQSTKHRSKSLRVLAQSDEKPLRRSQNDEVLDRPTKAEQRQFEAPTGSIRSRKADIISQAKEMFSRNEPVHPTTQRLPSIEAWLEEQPDPFVDAGSDLVEIPAPLKTRSSRQKVEISPVNVGDPNQIWTSVENQDQQPDRKASNGHGRRRRSRKAQEPSAATPPEVTSGSRVIEKTSRVSPTSQDRDPGRKEASTSGLKRRGAKALRVKTASSPSKQASPEPDFRSEGRSSAARADAAVEIPGSADEISRPLKPCPPTGYHCLSTIASVETFQIHAEDGNGVDIPARDSKGLQQGLTTHEDLMSVLSLPEGGGSMKSARSTRTTKSRWSAATLSEVLGELELDEKKYMRELITLVDGVIPVLLQCVLSKSDSAAAAGLFSSSGNARDDLNFTRPIVDMGIALERLKTLHKRVPSRDLTSLLSWSQSAHKVYIEYMKAWRLGFRDVVVNLAPPDGDPQTETDQGMARDANGDVINSDGEKVDVAYLLKRPLVRIKNLAKVFARLKTLKPSSKSIKTAESWDELLQTTRSRTSEERLRLEDEAAAHLDATKARDIRTLAVLSELKINLSHVRARDFFGLTVYHSNGQRLDCHIELVLRSDHTEPSQEGDLLICEVENTAKWLLFPPINTNKISVRLGDNEGEIVLMVRGLDSSVGDWYELLLLKTGDLEVASEWLNMLATQPVPPKIDRSSSFANQRAAGASSFQQGRAASGERLPVDSLFPGSEGVEVPIGEPSTLGSHHGYERSRRTPDICHHDPPVTSQANLESHIPTHFLITTDGEIATLPTVPHKRNEPKHTSSPHTPSFDASGSGLKRGKVATKRHGRRGEGPTSNRLDEVSREWMSSPIVQDSSLADQEEDQTSDFSQYTPSSKPQRPHYHRAISSTPSKELPTVRRVRPSDKPSTPLALSAQGNPSVRSRYRKQLNQGGNPVDTRSLQESVGEQLSQPATPFTDDASSPPPHQPQSPFPFTPEPAAVKTVLPLHQSLQQQYPTKTVPAFQPQQPQLPRNARRADRHSSSPLKHEYAPSTIYGSDESDDDSIISSSSEMVDDEEVEHDDIATPLVSIETAGLQRRSKVSPPASLPNLPTSTLAPSNSASQAPYRSIPHVNLQMNGQITKTIAIVKSWSEKGEWVDLHPDECSIVVSSGLIEVFEMSAAHSRDTTIPDDRTNSATTSLHESDEDGVRPLVAFELTPVVALRRGTALDISIRSPPTSRSRVQTNNNVMFRSRNAQECEGLYAMINYARINNPTWIALERARREQIPNITFNTAPGSARHSRSRSGPIFRFGSLGRRSSYRASSSRPGSSPSIAERSETSVASMSSAFSALRRLSNGANGGKGWFSLNRSSVVRRHRQFGPSAAASRPSSSSGTARTGGSGSRATSPTPSLRRGGPPAEDQEAASAETIPGGPVNELGIRLHIRDPAGRWRDLGAARLTVMAAPLAVLGTLQASTATSTTTNTITSSSTTTTTDNEQSPPGTASGSRPPSSFPTIGQPGQATREPRLPSSSHPHRVHGDGTEKRILVTGKTVGRSSCTPLSTRAVSSAWASGGSRSRCGRSTSRWRRLGEWWAGRRGLTCCRCGWRRRRCGCLGWWAGLGIESTGGEFGFAGWFGAVV